MIVCGCPVAKRPEAPQQVELVRPETSDIGESFRPGQNRQKAKQHNLVQRIRHLAGLARVRKIAEILQKNITAKDKDDARQTFFELTALVKNWNSSEWESEDFKKFEEQINEFLGS